MVTIAFYRNGFVVDGHANYAEHGKDIVCAAVSAITIGSLNWFENYDTDVQMGNGGNLALVINNPDKMTYKLLGLLYVQLNAIKANPNYEPYINITFSQNFLRGGKR